MIRISILLFTILLILPLSSPFSFQSNNCWMGLSFFAHAAEPTIKSTNVQEPTTDPILRIEFFRKEAEKGNIIAQYNLAVAYVNGDGVKQDYSEAAKLLLKAAERGDAISQFYLGTMYSHGQGLKQDYVEAANWYRKAADQGYSQAQRCLGYAYITGQGIKKRSHPPGGSLSKSNWRFTRFFSYIASGSLNFEAGTPLVLSARSKAWSGGYAAISLVKH